MCQSEEETDDWSLLADLSLGAGIPGLIDFFSPQPCLKFSRACKIEFRGNPICKSNNIITSPSGPPSSAHVIDKADIFSGIFIFFCFTIGALGMAAVLPAALLQSYQRFPSWCLSRYGYGYAITKELRLCLTTQPLCWEGWEGWEGWGG